MSEHYTLHAPNEGELGFEPELEQEFYDVAEHMCQDCAGCGPTNPYPKCGIVCDLDESPTGCYGCRQDCKKYEPHGECDWVDPRPRSEYLVKRDQNMMVRCGTCGSVLLFCDCMIFMPQEVRCAKPLVERDRYGRCLCHPWKYTGPYKPAPKCEFFDECGFPARSCDSCKEVRV